MVEFIASPADVALLVFQYPQDPSKDHTQGHVESPDCVLFEYVVQPCGKPLAKVSSQIIDGTDRKEYYSTKKRF